MQSPSDYAAREFGTLSDLVRLQAASRPDKIAVIDSRRSISYRRFDALVDRIAASLQRDGTAKGGVAAICAASSISYAAVFIGTLRAGAVISPLAPSSTGEQLARQLADSGATHLFLDAATQATIGDLLRDTGIRLVGLDADTSAVTLEEWLVPEGVAPQPVSIEPQDPFNIIYSSGTTGVPKGIVQPHGMRWRHCVPQDCVPQDPPGFGPDAVTLLATPLYSNTTLVTFIPTLAGGGTLVLMLKFEPLAYLELAQTHRVTHTMLVPVQYRRLMECERFGDFDLSSFVTKFCTSAPFPAELKREVLERWPGELVEFFGMTEGGGSCVLEAHLHPDKLHTVGKPMQGHKFLVVDENGEEVPSGKIGEIVGHSATVMTGYHNRPEETEKTMWRRSDSLLYIRTGDLGHVDEDGFVTVVGRKKDLIVSGGFNIYPSDIEAVIDTHPDVVESAVVGVPSPRWGETPVAFVVARGEVEAGTLRDWVNERVGKTQRLADLRLVDILPRSAIGKVLKTALAARYRENAKRVPDTSSTGGSNE